MPKVAANHEIADDKKEASQRRVLKKTMVTGIWPCKINGCNKQFAREADLKRHQRTTKLHSMPGFSCPQCDAAFTRTDALRRHQKSRHNGVVIEPLDQDHKDDAEDDGSSGSQSNSRSGTPSSKGKSRETQTQPPPPPQPRGPSSYYRSHTLTTSPSPYMTRPPAAQFPPPGLPPPPTRINMATTWGYPHSWPGGTTLGYQPVYYSPYYRHNGTIPPPLAPPPPGPNTCSQPRQTSSASLSTGPSPDTIQSNNSSDTTSNATPPHSTNIDTTLNAPDPTTELTEEQVLEITHAAVKAVLEAEAERSKARSQAASTTAPTASYSDMGDHSGDLDPTPDGISDNLDLNSLHRYGLDRPDEMEHILTEDGEPMLNPAELLTQESLASPPPS